MKGPYLSYKAQGDGIGSSNALHDGHHAVDALPPTAIRLHHLTEYMLVSAAREPRHDIIPGIPHCTPTPHEYDRVRASPLTE